MNTRSAPVATARALAEGLLAWAVVRASLAWPAMRASFGRAVVICALAAAVALVGADVVEWLAQAASDVATTLRVDVLALLVAILAGSPRRLLRAAYDAVAAASVRCPAPFADRFSSSSALRTEGLRGRAPPPARRLRARTLTT